MGNYLEMRKEKGNFKRNICSTRRTFKKQLNYILMKKLFIVILWSIPLFSLAQKSIQIKQEMNKGIAFLQFSSDSCSPAFITKLNDNYGYQQSLVAIYNEAPNFDDKKYSTKEIIKFSKEIQKTIQNSKNSKSLFIE